MQESRNYLLITQAAPATTLLEASASESWEQGTES